MVIDDGEVERISDALRVSRQTVRMLAVAAADEMMNYTTRAGRTARRGWEACDIDAYVMAVTAPAIERIDAALETLSDN